MLFHTWPFLVFMAVVLPVYLALRRTRLWVPWLLIASYVFYGWWNPWYLILILYSTALDFVLVALMDQCPGAPAGAVSGGPRPLENPTLRAAFLLAAAATVACASLAALGPPTLRPTLAALGVLCALMGLGAWFGNRRVWLLISLVNNLSILLFFKYARFLAENANAVLHSFHSTLVLPDPSGLMPYGAEYVLPVGISFFTFQSMSYSIDFYLGNVDRERSFIRFATFVSFFPQLVAGPIERAKHLLPQFHRFPTITGQHVADGLSLFLVGLFKKLALANYLSFYVERIYGRPEACAAPALILGTFAFAWQIYFDFSGYTDMARGVARLMGFDLMLNFNNPYLATGLGDFWARWHISLSTWFRDYVYIPLGGNRRGGLITARNLLLTFLISGIWHGAGWTFVIWGLLHGTGVIITRELERSAFYREKVPRLAKQVAVFVFVCFAWIFFRADSLNEALLIVHRIFTTGWRDPQMPMLMIGLVSTVWLYQFLYESRFREWLKAGGVRIGFATAMILYLCFCSSGGGAFIYFQF